MAAARSTSRWQMNWSGSKSSRKKSMNTYSIVPDQRDLICLSHLRWNFVFQRPQHLMSRFARTRRVFFIEEPVYDAVEPELAVKTCPQTNVHVATPHLSRDADTNKIAGKAHFLIRQVERHTGARGLVLYAHGARIFSQEHQAVRSHLRLHG